MTINHPEVGANPNPSDKVMLTNTITIIMDFRPYRSPAVPQINPQKASPEGTEKEISQL